MGHAQVEQSRGRGISQALKNGNKNSFGAILDANVTTLITAIILFIFGQKIGIRL